MAYKIPQPPQPEKLQIGWVTIPAGRYNYSGYANASWYTDYVVYNDERVPVYCYPKRDADGMLTIGRDVYYDVTGTIVETNFQSQFFGNNVGTVYDRKQDYGKPFTRSTSNYAYNFVAGVQSDESPYELIDDGRFIIAGHTVYHPPHTGDHYDRGKSRDLLAGRKTETGKLKTELFYAGCEWDTIWLLTADNRYMPNNARVSTVGRFIRHDHIYVDDGSLAFELLQDGLDLVTVKALALPRRRERTQYHKGYINRHSPALVPGTRMYAEPGMTTYTEKQIESEIAYVAATVAGTPENKHPFRHMSQRKPNEMPFSAQVMTDLSTIDG